MSLKYKTFDACTHFTPQSTEKKPPILGGRHKPKPTAAANAGLSPKSLLWYSDGRKTAQQLANASTPCAGASKLAGWRCPARFHDTCREFLPEPVLKTPASPERRSAAPKREPFATRW
ncbi:hypothetical protein ZHAS_00004956 [Anopheles sinensis]|uniref:Uncharacterized protein n=1 Tax=Anopheles sinensis TaxID=74873 RepID=A0A084VIJ7_ANOSI|nr:hypothetical protein ZHAS_00004956 [Anopheles sinensis]